MHPQLIETLRQAQRFGFFGGGDMVAAAAHSHAFVEALGAVGPGTRLIDLGSGGGLPGLVVADAFPEATVMLLDRREKRTDFLERAVRRLGWTHVTVRCDQARNVVAEVAAGVTEPFNVVTARGFGPPEITLRTGVAVCTRPGRILISEPPAGNRWDPALLDDLGVTARRRGAVRIFDVLPR